MSDLTQPSRARRLSRRLALPAALLLSAVPFLAHAEDVPAVVPGQRLAGELIGAEVLRVKVVGVQGMELSLKALGSRKAGNRPVVSLLDPDGGAVDLTPYVKANGPDHKLIVSKVPLAKTGEYELALEDEAGNGGTLRLLTKAKQPRRQVDEFEITTPGEVVELPFSAQAGDAAKLVVKKTKGSALTPWIRALVLESGAETEVQDGRRSAMLTVDETGEHHFTVTGADDSVGTGRFVLKLKPRKASRKMTDLRTHGIVDHTLRDDASVYAEPGILPVDVYVVIDPADNPESEEDTDCGFIDPTDGIGTTLDDVNQDEDPSDDCKPEVDVRVAMEGLVDHEGQANAELRVRGHSTRFTSQKSYRIKLDSKKAEKHWRGQRYLNLNKHPYDLTRLRNKLAFDLLAEIPDITSLRTQFVRLHIDQLDGDGFVDYGLFTHVERPDERFLEAHGLDPQGNLYKAEFFEFHRYADHLKTEDDPTYDEDAFEEILEIKAGDDHTVLLEMLDALNDGGQDFAEVFDRYFEEENYLTWLATSFLFDNRDTNSQNFFLYRPSTSTKFYFLPWDYDGAWGFYGQPNEAASPSLAPWQEGLPNWWGVVIHKRFLQEPGAVEKLQAKMLELKDTYLTPQQIQAKVDAYLPTVRQFVGRDPDLARLPVVDFSSPTVKLEQYETEAARLSTIIEESYQRLLDTLDRPMPMFTDTADRGDQIEFRWDPSFDLQGDPIVYDVVVSSTAGFEPENILLEQLGLSDTTSYRHAKSAFAPGEYFLRVTVREAGDPTSNQVAFGSYWDQVADVVYFGIRPFTVE